MKREGIFQKTARWLVQKTQPEKRGKYKRKLHEEVMLLSNGRKDALEAYYIRKYKQVLEGIFLGILLLAAAFIAAGKQQRQTGGSLDRPGYQQADAEESLQMIVEGESEETALQVHISRQRYTEKQAERLLDEAQRILEKGIVGGNASADEVRQPLWMPTSLLEGAVSISYITMPYGMVSDDGEIVGDPGEEGTPIEIRAALTCQDITRDLLMEVRVYPPILTGEQAFLRDVQHALQEADEDSVQEDVFILPEEVNGRKLSWLYPSESYISLAGALLLLLPLCLWYLSDSQVREAAKEREQSLLLDYGSLMWKLTMLVGAGLTVRSAFFKIAEEYQRSLRRRQMAVGKSEGMQNGLPGSMPGGSAAPGGRQDSPPGGIFGKKEKRRYAYEEVVMTCREMQSGVSEAEAYENFGKRCALPCYIRLSGLLSQNLRKGSKGLIRILEREADSAAEQRRMTAKELSEKAGTKLLLPMVLMLGVVIIVLVVPAFMSM